MWACVMTIAWTCSECFSRIARMFWISSPGSITMAWRDCSSPKMEQLHCNRPTGIISWIIPDCILGLGAPRRVVTMNRVVIMNGYQALREHAAWLDLSGRGKIRATGEDRARLLHAMTTQQVEQMKPGDGAYAFFLNAQGRILGDVNLFCLEEHFLLDTEPETRQKLFEHVDRYIIADDVTLEDLTEEMATIAVEGPQAASVLEKLGAPIPEAPYQTRAWGDRIIARVSSTG